MMAATSSTMVTRIDHCQNVTTSTTAATTAATIV